MSDFLEGLLHFQTLISNHLMEIFYQLMRFPCRYAKYSKIRTIPGFIGIKQAYHLF